MIRLNLLRNTFGTSTSRAPAPESLDLDFDSQESFAVHRSRKPLWLSLAAGLVVAGGLGAWWMTRQDTVDVPPATSQEAAIPAATKPAEPDPAKAPAPATDSVKPAPAVPPLDPAVAAAAKAESLKVAAQARQDSLKLAKASEAERKAAAAKARQDSIAQAKLAKAEAEKARKEALAAAAARRADSVKAFKQRREDSIQLARQRKADSIAQAKEAAARAREVASRPTAPSLPVRVAPAVTAPPLAGGVVDLVLGEARQKAGAVSATPSRFEDLIPTARVAYQRFAFEQILAKLRQVTPANGVGYSHVRIHSPGILVVDGEVQSPAILAELVRGLSAQSMVDTSSTLESSGRFRVVARLPFSASAAAAAPLSSNWATDAQRALDLAAAQGLVFGKAPAAAVKPSAPFRRATWKLSGKGSWDGCSRWIASLGASGSPLGFTSLELLSGPDATLKIHASVIAYGK